MAKDIVVADSGFNGSLAFPAFPGGKRRKGKKGKKNKGGGGEVVLADDVNTSIWESGGMVLGQKFYFRGQLDKIDADEKIKDKTKEKQTLCLKAIGLGILMRRMLAPGSTLHTMAKSVQAVGAVNLGNQL